MTIAYKIIERVSLILKSGINILLFLSEARWCREVKLFSHSNLIIVNKFNSNLILVVVPLTYSTLVIALPGNKTAKYADIMILFYF